MKQTFVVDINYDDQYRIICDLVNEPIEPHSYLTKEVVLLKDQRANVGDTVYFRCLHYWYKGIIAMGVVDELSEDNCVDVRFIVAINPKEQPFLSISELRKVLPNKNWGDLYTHIELNDDEAQVLKILGNCLAATLSKKGTESSTFVVHPPHKKNDSEQTAPLRNPMWLNHPKSTPSLLG